MFNRVIIIFLVFIVCLEVQAQDSTGMQTRTFQFSFFTPIGTNGLNSWNVKNRLSVNLLSGYAGGLNGIEFSGLTSLLKRDMTGVQFSGLGNLVLGYARGVQFSGLGNLTLGETKGAQFSGLINLLADSATGVQLAGFSNIIIKKAKGFQGAGFLNYVQGGKASMISGFANITPKDLKGIQIAGFSNISSGYTKGVQIAGFFNFARKLKGVQIAPFNYVDSLEKGIPIGVLSFVRNGYRTVEFNATETMYGVVSVKTGVRSFYSILSTGVGYHDNMLLWGWGYGLGGMVPLSSKWDLAIEGVCYHMNEDEWFTNMLNLLNRISFVFSRKVSDHLNIQAGFSWNVAVEDITNEYGEKIKSHIAPWSVFEKTFDDHINVKMYPGIILGIKI